MGFRCVSSRTLGRVVRDSESTRYVSLEVIYSGFIIEALMHAYMERRGGVCGGFTSIVEGLTLTLIKALLLETLKIDP